MTTDFTDSHAYWDPFGCWTLDEKRFMNRSLLGERATWIEEFSSFRTLHKPFCVSEWDPP